MLCFVEWDFNDGAGPTSLCVKILIHAAIFTHETEHGPIQRIHNKFRLREIRDCYSPLRRRRRCRSHGVLGKKGICATSDCLSSMFSLSVNFITDFYFRLSGHGPTSANERKIFMGHNRPSGTIKGDSLISVCARLNMANSVRYHFLTTLCIYIWHQKIIPLCELWGDGTRHSPQNWIEYFFKFREHSLLVSHWLRVCEYRHHNKIELVGECEISHLLSSFVQQISNGCGFSHERNVV